MTRIRYTHRSASWEDLERIVEIYNSTIPSRMVTGDTQPVSVTAREAWFAEHDPVARPLWIAEQGNRCVGWLSLSSFYGRPAYEATVEVSLYVDQNHRRQGVGTYLLNEAVSVAPRIGIETLLGFIFGHNEPSLALFHRFGFTQWGRLPRVARMDGIERDVVILGRRI